MIVTHRHYRTMPSRRGIGLCNGGGRAWFARHGLDWGSFVHHGIDEAALLATGDGLALQLVEWARQCEAEARADG